MPSERKDDMETRGMTEMDFASCAKIFYDSLNELHRRYGVKEEDPSDTGWLSAGLGHFLVTDPGRQRVAVSGGELVAFGSAIQRDRYWFLSFLFVDPRAQSKGVGRQLLSELVPEASGDRVMATVVESFQPVSTALYATFGITPRSAKYWLSGVSRPEALPDLPGDLSKAAMSEADLDAITDLDRRILGFSRLADHRFWAGEGSGRFVYRRSGDVVAYAYVDADGHIAPALATDEATLCVVVADMVRTRQDSASFTTNVFGHSAALLRMLLQAGARIDDGGHRMIYCSSEGPLPPSYLSDRDWLP